MSLSVETVYNGAGNPIDLRFNVDGDVLADHSVITRAVLEVGAGSTILSPAVFRTIDSQASPEYFDFTGVDYMSLLLGAAGLADGRYNCAITIYYPGYPDGLAFGTTLELRVQ